MSWLGQSRRNTVRLGAMVAILLLLAPAGSAALLDSPETPHDRSQLRQTATNVTFVSTQGGAVRVYEHAGALVGIHTETRRVIWRHDRYRRYMDVDPLDSDRVLFVAGQRYENGTVRRYAVVVNWRNGTVHERFRVPHDTHDVDFLGRSRYAIADKSSHRVYVINATTGSTRWQYEFPDHFPPSAGGGIEGDYTHLNDIDSIDNGTAFLVSPRNFDRVMAIDRANKEIRWTLGEENEYGTLHEQHNPVLLRRNPLTVLVADSENDRVIEYQRAASEWEPVWVYTGDLAWPRDADRLPNGNTLITDTVNDRVIEVTPDRRIVWEFSTGRGPYDAERLPYGDEPKGPPMAAHRSEFDGATPTTASEDSVYMLTLPFKQSYNKFYQLVGVWVLPPGAGRTEFVWALLAVLLGVGWLSVETALRVPVSRLRGAASTRRLWRGTVPFVGLLGLISGGGILFLLPGSGSQTSTYAAVGVVLLNLGTLLSERAIVEFDRRNGTVDRILFVTKVGLSGGSVLLAGLLIVNQLSRPTELVFFGALAAMVLSSAAGLWTRSRPGGS